MVEDFTATTAPSVKVSTETTGSSKSKPPINGRSDSTNGKKTEYYIENDWMEGIAVPVFALDLSLNVTAWNQQAAESTGLSAQEIIKMPLESILQDNSRARLDYAIQELIQNNGDSSSSCDLTFCISGSLRSFHTKMSAQKNTSKELIGVVCFTEEIRPPIHPAPTSPYSMSLVFDDCDFPTVGLNLEGNIQSWSTSMVNISGYTKEEVMGRRFSEYAAAESYRQRVNEMVLATNQGKRSKPIQFELRDKHGQTRQLLLNVSASRDQNRTACGVIMVITDLSDDEQSLSTTSDGVDNPTRKQILRTSHKVEERSPLLEITTVPIFGIDRDGSNTSWNPKMSSLTGFGQEEALDGRFVRDFVCPDFQSSTQQYFERCLAGSELSCLETEIKSKDGKNIRLFLNVSPGQVQDHGLMVFATDVTTIFERWKAAEEFKMLVDTANAPVFGIDRNGCIDLWNSMAAHVLGFSRDFVMGKSLVETFIDPILRHSVQVVLDMALEGHGTSNYELEFQTESGEIRYLLANITTRRDAGGEIVGVVGFAQDVTEAAQNDRAIAAMARELRQLLDTANTPVFGVDTAGRVNEWNDKTAEITGFSSDEAFNQPFVETFMVPDLRASVQEVVDNALRGRGTSNFELEIRNKANEIRFLLVNATTRRDAENNVVGMFCVAQDVTEACKHDRAVAAMANELRQLIDTANAPIFGIDRDGYVFIFVFCLHIVTQTKISPCHFLQ
jgi:PAS domain S-box-containing protein